MPLANDKFADWGRQQVGFANQGAAKPLRLPRRQEFAEEILLGAPQI